MSLLEEKSVRRVNAALSAASVLGAVRELPQGGGGTLDVAGTLGIDPGAVVRVQMFTIDRRFVMALIAGDRSCREDQLPRAFFMKGAVARPDGSYVRAITGFPAAAVSPAGMTNRLPTVIDSSLKRFETIYAPAGHPACVFPTTVAELKRLTGGIVSYAVSEPSSAD